MTEILGWHKQSPVRKGSEHLVLYSYPSEGGWRAQPYVRDEPTGERPTMLGDGERIHIVDAINEYLVNEDIPEEAQGWWAALKLKLLEGVE